MEARRRGGGDLRVARDRRLGRYLVVREAAAAVDRRRRALAVAAVEAFAVALGAAARENCVARRIAPRRERVGAE